MDIDKHTGWLDLLIFIFILPVHDGFCLGSCNMERERDRDRDKETDRQRQREREIWIGWIAFLSFSSSSNSWWVSSSALQHGYI